MAAATDLPNGYYKVLPGKLANAVTWLEMRTRPTARLCEPLIRCHWRALALEPGL